MVIITIITSGYPTWLPTRYTPAFLCCSVLVLKYRLLGPIPHNSVSLYLGAQDSMSMLIILMSSLSSGFGNHSSVEGEHSGLWHLTVTS